MIQYSDLDTANYVQHLMHEQHQGNLILHAHEKIKTEISKYRHPKIDKEIMIMRLINQQARP